MSNQSVKLVELPAHFSQVQLSGLKQIVDHHHDDGHHVQFDASDVDRLDGAAVQFLLAVSRFQTGDGKPATVIGTVNDALLNALADMGINDLQILNTQEDQSTSTAA